MSNQRRNQRGNSRRRSGKSQRRKRVDPKKFWGDMSLIDELAEQQKLTKMSAKPEAVIQSLGRVPLSWPQESVDERLKAVYERASMLAGALAAANDQIDTDDLLG